MRGPRPVSPPVQPAFAVITDQGLPAPGSLGSGLLPRGAVLGRSVESAVIGAFLERIQDGPYALEIIGEPGVGKSTLWEWAIEQARARGWTVLTARPVEAETGQSYAALADLLGPIAATTLAQLPAPQRRAMEEVLLLQDPDPDDRVDPRAVSAAAAGMVRAVASAGPAVIAIDDVAWLDSASQRVVASVLRRLEGFAVGIVVTSRTEPDAGRSPLGLVRALGAGRLERLELAGFTRGALQQLLHRNLGMTFARPTLGRIHAASAGNAYVALEIARAIGRLPRPIRLHEPLPVPSTVRALVRDRLEGLAPDVRLALLAVVASATSTGAEVAAVIGDAARADRALAQAERAGLVISEHGRYRAAHPLLASTVYADTDAVERRLVHSRLAEVVPDPEGRARHLARSTVEPVEAIAATLESASVDARVRGAPDGAAELLRLAVELTPDREPGLGRRRMLLGTALLEIGSSQAATGELDRALALLPPGRDRAAAGLQRAIAAWYAAPDRSAEELAEAALDDAADDPALAARIEAYLAVFCVDQPRAAAHAGASIALADATGAAVEPAVRALAIWQRFMGEVLMGRAPDAELAARGRALEPIDDPAQAPTVPGLWALATGRLGEARAFFEDLLARAAATGAVTSDADLEAHLAETELEAGNWDAALEHVDRARGAAIDLEQAIPPAAIRVEAQIRARRGDPGIARDLVRAQLEALPPARDPLVDAGWLQTATGIELIAGDAVAADGHASDASRILATIGVVEPLLLDTAADHAEALVSLGDLSRATDLLTGLERRHATIPRAGHAAAIARIHALLATTADEVAAALAATAPALDEDGGWPPYDRGRTLLARAVLQRRRRDRRGATVSLRAALGIADRLGARLLRQRILDEQDRLGSRRAGTLELTPTELQVAELTASGRTNREVAARLYMSPKTVEAHLSRIYGKLGIASRAELGRTMAAHPPAGRELETSSSD